MVHSTAAVIHTSMIHPIVVRSSKVPDSQRLRRVDLRSSGVVSAEDDFFSRFFYCSNDLDTVHLNGGVVHIRSRSDELIHNRNYYYFFLMTYWPSPF